MFDYIVNTKLRDAVIEGYHLCRQANNYTAFIEFLDKLDLPSKDSIRVVMDVLTGGHKALNEGLEYGLKNILTAAGMKEFNTVAFDDTDNGIMPFDMHNCQPIKSTYTARIGDTEYPIECYSLLGRRQSKYGFDGNPLIYAIKRINQWRFASAQDFSIMVDYCYNALKSKTWGDAVLNDIDVMVPVPSSSSINKAMVNCIHRDIRPTIVTVDSLRKQTVDSVYKTVDDTVIGRLLLPKLYPECNESTAEGQRLIMGIMRELEKSQAKNTDFNREHGLLDNPFSIKFVLPKYRSVFTDYITGELPAEMLTGKNVLVVDDSISTGASLVNVIEQFIMPHMPASIKALTLLSPLNAG